MGGRDGPRRGHRPRTRHRRPAARLRRRPLRGLRGEDVPRAERSRARPLPRRKRGGRPRGGGGIRRARCRPRQPPDHGPGGPGPGRPGVRGQGARLRSLLHGAAASGPLRSLRPRGHRRRFWAAGGVPLHRGGPVEDRRRPGPPRPDPARSPRRGHPGVSSGAGVGGRAQGGRAGRPNRGRAPGPELRARRARRGERAAGVGPGVSPRPLRRQAVAQQGRGPAGRGLAGGEARASRGDPVAGRLRGSEVRAGVSGRRARRGRLRTRSRSAGGWSIRRSPR